jgi:hypothetical protein
MKFQTLTSEYEITADGFGVMTLEKTAILPGCRSKVEVGQRFFAKRGDAITFGRDGNRQLLFGNMNTSRIPDYEGLEKWLEEQRHK